MVVYMAIIDDVKYIVKLYVKIFDKRKELIN